MNAKNVCAPSNGAKSQGIKRHEVKVKRLQMRIVKAQKQKKHNKVREASSSINNIINNIQNKTDQIVTITYNSENVIKQQMEVVVKTDNAFKTILNAMEGISEILYQLI